MPDYKIVFKNRRVQPITADSYGVYGDFFVFSRDGKDIQSVAKSEVESVGLAELAEPKMPAPRSVGV